MPKEVSEFRAPNQIEWKTLESKFSCKFPNEMYHFINLMKIFSFPGDILNVGAGPNNDNDNDTIDYVYDFEIKENPTWKQNMVPFYSIGNGDYFCISASEDCLSAVYYYYLDRKAFVKHCESFEEWIVDLPIFLE